MESARTARLSIAWRSLVASRGDGAAPVSPTEPSKRLGRPPSCDSNETRDRLLEVARRAFAAYGYGATTNKDIAIEAGITTGAIYHYFASKADLYVAAYERVQAIAYDAFEAAVAGVNSLPDRLDAVLDAAVALGRDDPTLAGFLGNVPWESQRHEELRERMRVAHAPGRAFFERLVAEAAGRGELPPDVEQGAVVDMVGALVAGLARFSAQTGDHARHCAATDAMKALIDGRLFSRP